ncbi:MAG: hypothetical protein IH897_03695 [Planctomycetes bacterium]|nr:hypothetical protein [Planctomycetota bacterium]
MNAPEATDALEMKAAHPEDATVAAAVTVVAAVDPAAAVAEEEVDRAVATADHDRATAPVVHARVAVGLPRGRQILCTVSHEACH